MTCKRIWRWMFHNEEGRGCHWRMKGPGTVPRGVLLMATLLVSVQSLPSATPPAQISPDQVPLSEVDSEFQVWLRQLRSGTPIISRALLPCCGPTNPRRSISSTIRAARL